MKELKSSGGAASARFHKTFVGVDFDLVPMEIFQKSNISYPAYDGVTNASFLKNLCLY